MTSLYFPKKEDFFSLKECEDKELLNRFYEDSGFQQP